MTFDELWTDISAFLPGLIAAVPVAAAVILGGILINLVIGRALGLLAKRTHLSPTDIAPARNLLRWLVRIITFVLVLGVFGFELGGLWAMISTVLAMVAIGFVAVWSLVSHTTATVLLVTLRPFHVGDDIAMPSENVEGRVIDINFFFTTLIDHEGVQWRVPNNLFFQKVIKRTVRQRYASLAQQLNNSTAAPLDPPPPPPKDDEKDEDKKPKSAADDDAARAIPDPATLTPKR
ncbi:mechanosensitive ion channel family protein [Actomonas aquatica]|uniref:Mechanosensitive ion channel family protein n=1 Tax=Actomonas aquatica TaxID=2866162 RepID=A0ABZ1C6I9_9BACT|nr:mechanosensitive ion channel family protein [Opitutus sp. WL0086]WRQ86947.1 mechanosensitive ion channel family protein [Opitutus sp. WL0086]